MPPQKFKYSSTAWTVVHEKLTAAQRVSRCRGVLKPWGSLLCLQDPVLCPYTFSQINRVQIRTSRFFKGNPPPWRCSPTRAMASSFMRFLDHTQRRITVGRTPLDEWSARRRDQYLTTHTTLTTDKHPCPRWDSNPRSQQASGPRPTQF